MIADELAEGFGKQDMFENIQAINGYLNFTIDKGIYAKSVVEEVIAKGDAFGSSDMGNGKTVIVEFSSPNIANIPYGHIRTTVIGNSLYKIHKFLGYNTVGINHLGDYGTQFGKLIVAYKLWGDKEAIEKDPIPELLKIYVKFHEEAENKPEMEDEAREWFSKLENNDAEAYELWKWFREVSLSEFSRVYDTLGVEFDSLAGESFYSDRIPAVLEEMREKNVMTNSEGAEIVDLEPMDYHLHSLLKRWVVTLYYARPCSCSLP